MGAQTGAIDEQLDRGAEIERRDRPDLLAVQAQRRSAGREHAQRRATIQQLGDQGRDRINQVFAVVEHQEDPLGGQLLDESVLRRSQGLVVDPETGGDRGCHQAFVPHGCELDEAHTRRIPIGEPGGQFHAEPGLPAARRPHEGHQPDAIEHPHQFAGVRVTTDEPSQQATTALDHDMLV